MAIARRKTVDLSKNSQFFKHLAPLLTGRNEKRPQI
jgi:hypothetical protein